MNWIARQASFTSSEHFPAGDCCLSALVYVTFTGLLAALSFSFGLELVRPRTGMPAARREFLVALNWMDGHWYGEIATEGYHYNTTSRSNVAFYPVYPLLARAVSAATGLRIEAALLIVSNFFLFAALGTLCAYVRLRYTNAPDELADWVLLAAALFPTGCFFRLAYTESTFLFISVATLYSIERRWPLCFIALLVALATATRPVGVALVGPFAIHMLRRLRDGDSIAPTRVPSCANRVPLATALRLALWLPVCCWGLLGFMAYQHLAFGDAMASFKTQKHWGIRDDLSWPRKAVALATLEPIRSVYNHESEAFWASHDLHGMPWFSLQFSNPLFFAACAALVAIGALRQWLTIEETALSVLLMLIPYIGRGYESGMGSMGRFVAVVFPMYLVLGHLLARLPSAPRAVFLISLAGLLALYTALYAARYPIF